MRYCILLFLAVSCSKAVETNHDRKTTTVLVSPYLVRQLDETLLSITMNPVLTCYAYSNGESPRPCDIFIEITCTLSRPIQHWLRVELVKSNGHGVYMDPQNEPGNMVLNIAPNQTKLVFRSNWANNNNNTIPDIFRIVDAVVYNRPD